MLLDYTNEADVADQVKGQVAKSEGQVSVNGKHFRKHFNLNVIKVYVIFASHTSMIKGHTGHLQHAVQ